MKACFIAIALGLGCSVASASSSPYQGEESRPVKALSAEQIEALMRGDGMGFALAAELNHYPGPRHVLDLAAELALSESQLSQSRTIFERMQAEAVRLGRLLIDSEMALDGEFEQRSVTPESLARRLSEIGEIRARLRGVHLQAHLQQRELLTPHQLHRYDLLRGYRDASGDHADGHRQHN